MVDFSKLPIELIKIIINYTDIVVYRHGKYLNRIRKDDMRYRIIETIKKPISVGNFLKIFKFTFHNSFEKKYILMEQKYDQNNNKHYLTQKIIIKSDDNLSFIENQTYYKFDLQGKCYKIVNYIM